MSSVPKSKQEAHDFMADHKLRQIRKAVTELAVNDFGYDREKLEKKIEKFEQNLPDTDRKAEIVARMRAKNTSFYEDFVKEEERETRAILRKAVSAFEMGNSIYPDGTAVYMEFCERRKYLDYSIGHMNCLKQELQYIAEILPGDKNRYQYLIDEIKEEITLIKGVRRNANKFLKPKDKKKR